LQRHKRYRRRRSSLLAFLDCLIPHLGQLLVNLRLVQVVEGLIPVPSPASLSGALFRALMIILEILRHLIGHFVGLLLVAV